MQTLNTIVSKLTEVLNFELFKLGHTQFSLKTILFIIFSLTVLSFAAGKIKKIIGKKVLVKYGIEPGTSISIASMIQYLVLILGTMVILQSAGVDLSTLGFLVGALGIGIGFGLQNITSNFISGIIILLERPIKVGDRIDLGNLAGNVVKISTRATTVVTNDNINVIVPNSEFINNKVINWSLTDRKVRLNIPIGVSYNEDPEQIRKILLEVAYENESILKDPKPDVLFEDYGDSSLNFNLRVWTEDYIDKPIVLKSQVNYAIFKKFKEHQIEIPFPQRDIHIRSGLNINS